VCTAASLETMRTVVRNGYIDLDAPDQSLLLLKPLSAAQGGVVHGGHEKFEGTDDPAYLAFRDWLERYATCAESNTELPRPEREPSPTGFVDAGPESPIFAYCNCMLSSCHDIFHFLWGETDAEATAGCRAAALQLDVAGEARVDGDFIECRLRYCELALTAPGACAAAGGAAPCQ
jgi:hypothetical protein